MPNIRKIEEHTNINFFLYSFVASPGRNIVKKKNFLVNKVL